MINPVQTSIPRPDGGARYVIIEPIIEKDAAQVLRETGVFKIYKDAFGDETHLFTEPAELNEKSDDLPDERNPDYLGQFIVVDGNYRFEGDALSDDEQEYLRIFIKDFQEHK